jgi:heme/copper-type cytochrome/quinol oxidase subunit 1
MIKIKEYFLLFNSSLILLIIGFLVGEETFDINVHDTYYVIANCHLYWLFSSLLFIIFIFYFLLNIIKIELNRIISKIHIFGTIISIILLIFPYSLFDNPKEFPLYDSFEYINIVLTVSFLVLLFLQLLFIINIFVSLIKKIKSHRASRLHK